MEIETIRQRLGREKRLEHIT